MILFVAMLKEGSRVGCEEVNVGMQVWIVWYFILSNGVYMSLLTAESENECI